MLSKNGVALVVFAVEFILTSLGIQSEPGSVGKVVEGAILVGSFLVMVWNQLDRTNVNWFIFKK
jgi:hypothetical protein